MERSLGLAFTTLTIFAPLAQAAHPQQAIKPEGAAGPLEFVATGPTPRGFAFARQVLPAHATAPVRAQSRVIYDRNNTAGSGMTGGCTAAGGGAGGAMALAFFGVFRRRRR